MLTKTSVYFALIAVFQFIAMAFLIICCVTAPVFKQIGLSQHEDITYGTFGYCSADDGCSSAAASYDPYSLTSNDDDWKMNSTARKALGNILIVMPIAAGLNFFAFVGAAVSFVLSLVRPSTSGSIPAATFIINLILQLVAFLSAALMCIVSFLLFFPHVTWCTWLLIPAGVLPLLSMPLMFAAYMAKDPDMARDEGDITAMDGSERLLRAEDLYENVNQDTVLPDIQPATRRPDGSSFGTTYNSSGSTLDKEKYDMYNTTTDELDESQDNSDAEVYAENEEKGTPKRFSAIRSDAGDSMEDNAHGMRQFNMSQSLASSVYSQKDHYSEVQPKNKILEDFMDKDGNKGLGAPYIPEEGEDDGSVVTSVSRNGVNTSNPGNRNMGGNAPYPHPSNGASQQTNNQYPRYQNQGQLPPPQQQQRPMNMGNARGPQMNYPPQQRNFGPQMNYPPQQRNFGPQPYYPQQQHFAPQGPSASEMIMQNNPNFLPNGPGRINQRMQRPFQQQQPQGGFGGSNTHFAPAYKKRMNNRTNTMQNINNAGGMGGAAAYNFR